MPIKELTVWTIGHRLYSAPVRDPDVLAADVHESVFSQADGGFRSCLPHSPDRVSNLFVVMPDNFSEVESTLASGKLAIITVTGL